MLSHSTTISPPFHIVHQRCVLQAPLQKQLDVPYAHAEKAKANFDDFGRRAVQQRFGLEPDASMLEYGEKVYITYKKRLHSKGAIELSKRLRVYLRVTLAYSSIWFDHRLWLTPNLTLRL